MFLKSRAGVAGYMFFKEDNQRRARQKQHTDKTRWRTKMMSEKEWEGKNFFVISTVLVHFSFIVVINVINMVEIA